MQRTSATRYPAALTTQQNRIETNPRADSIESKAPLLTRKAALYCGIKYPPPQLLLIRTQSQACRDFRCRNTRGKSQDTSCHCRRGTEATGTPRREPPLSADVEMVCGWVLLNNSDQAGAGEADRKARDVSLLESLTDRVRTTRPDRSQVRLVFLTSSLYFMLSKLTW